ncbi:MAG: hypothetical protein IJ527_08985 [Prevotella sp.]|nr:hypothetical protein [Prevotella sp.]
MDRKITIVTLLLVLLCGCRQRSVSIEELARMDSLARLEAGEPEASTAYGTAAEDYFYELKVRLLPLRNSETFLRMLPNFSDVPVGIASAVFGIEDMSDVKAVRLPDYRNFHMALVAGRDAEGVKTLSLVSLDASCHAVDRLPLYEVTSAGDDEDEQMGLWTTDFSMTSNYEIYIMRLFVEFGKDEPKLQDIDEYGVGDDGMFVLKAKPQAVLNEE